MQNRSWQSATDDFFFAGGRPCLYFRVFIRRGLANNPSVLLKSLERAATVRWQLTSIHRIFARHLQSSGFGARCKVADGADLRQVTP